VDVEPTPTGGYNVGWADAGEWLNYTVNVTAAGNYTVVARVASAGTGGTFHIELNGSNKTDSMRIPNTGGWQAYQDVSVTVQLEAGVQVMRIVYDSNGSTGAVGNISWVRFDSGSAPPPSGGGSSGSGPFGGSPAAIPGTIQSEDFDHGGNGVGYYDNSPGNISGAYRSTDVDIESTSNGGYAVGWANAGEWLSYTVNVAASGHYNVVARVASNGSGGSFHVELNGEDKTGAMWVPGTGGWGRYQDVSATVWLDAGVQSMRVVLDSNGSTGFVGNFSFVRFEQGSAPAPAPSPSPGGGRLRVMTWNIHFGNGDPWGQAQEIANSGADVVLLQEASTYDEHMPSTYPDRLRQLTGQTWYSAWGPSNPEAGGSQGTLILSRYRIVDQTSAVLTGTGTVRALVGVGGVRVNVFNVHLEYYDTGKRTTQLYQFMDWMRQFGGPRISGGDFNSWWGEWWIAQMESEYSDTWQDVTGSDENGYTLNGTVRFDYLFRSFDQNWRLSPTACWVQGTSRSDHAQLIADYAVQ
jgi:endonuclease/exonuclease/phosphatase family metal-dependent hydrolase